MIKKIVIITLLVLSATYSFSEPERFIECSGKLIKYDEKFHFFEDNEFGHSDFAAPLATFQIVSPENYLDRVVKVVFLGSEYDGMLKEIEKDVGEIFIFEIPEGFFKSESVIIKQIHLKTFGKKKL